MRELIRIETDKSKIIILEISRFVLHMEKYIFDLKQRGAVLKNYITEEIIERCTYEYLDIEAAQSRVYGYLKKYNVDNQRRVTLRCNYCVSTQKLLHVKIYIRRKKDLQTILDWNSYSKGTRGRKTAKSTIKAPEK